MLSLNLFRQLQLNFLNVPKSTDVLVMTVEAEVDVLSVLALCCGTLLSHDL